MPAHNYPYVLFLLLLSACTKPGSVAEADRGVQCPEVPQNLVVNPSLAQLDGLPPPKPTNRTPPLYPVCGEIRRTWGVVDLQFTVEADGSVGDAIVQQEVPAGFGFAEEVLKVFPSWKFQPTIVDGKPTARKVYYRVSLKLG